MLWRSMKLAYIYLKNSSSSSRNFKTTNNINKLLERFYWDTATGGGGGAWLMDGRGWAAVILQTHLTLFRKFNGQNLPI